MIFLDHMNMSVSNDVILHPAEEKQANFFCAYAWGYKLTTQ